MPTTPFVRDDTIPGRSEVRDWRHRPVGLAVVPLSSTCCTDTYRHPRSGLLFTMVDEEMHRYSFFFDGFVGRLCTGKDQDDPDAAFVVRGCPVDRDVCEALELWRHRDPAVGRALERWGSSP